MHVASVTWIVPVMCTILVGACAAERPMFLYTADLPPVPAKCDFLLKLDVGQARKDARLALRRGDDRFVAVGGVAMMHPGLPKGASVPAARSHYVECTNDMIAYRNQPELQLNAWNYAERYNKVILRSKPLPPGK